MVRSVFEKLLYIQTFVAESYQAQILLDIAFTDDLLNPESAGRNSTAMDIVDEVSVCFS